MREGNQKEARGSTGNLLSDPGRGWMVVAWIPMVMIGVVQTSQIMGVFDVRASEWIGCGEQDPKILA